MSIKPNNSRHLFVSLAFDWMKKLSRQSPKFGTVSTPLHFHFQVVCDDSILFAHNFALAFFFSNLHGDRFVRQVNWNWTLLISMHSATAECFSATTHDWLHRRDETCQSFECLASEISIRIRSFSLFCDDTWRTIVGQQWFTKRLYW